MASSSGLDDTAMPQWKKDLILRKRAQQQNTTSSSTSSKQLSSNVIAAAATSTSTECGVGSGSDTSRYAVEQPAQVQSHSVGNGSSVNAVLSNVKCGDTTADISEIIQNEVKMVQDSVLVMRAPITRAVTNGDCYKGNDSDSSEELQYGPGIVSKLKSKYLSLTLREATVKPRPSILPLRRATSLENMLDADSADDEHNNENNTTLNGDGGPKTKVLTGKNQVRTYIPRTAPERNGTTRNSQNRYRNATRGNEPIKRARSVEPLVRPDTTTTSDDLIIAVSQEGNDISNRKRNDNNKIPTTNNDKKSFSNQNGGQRLNRPKRIAPVMDETERPPADHVKQTLMLFEGPAIRRTRAPRTTGDVAAKVANFRHIIDQEKQNNNNINNTTKKPHITPKPVLIPPRKGSPVKRPVTPESQTVSPSPPPLSPKPSPIPDVSRIASETCESPRLDTEQRTRPNTTTLSQTPDLIVHSSPVATSPRIYSPTALKNITTEFIKAEVKSSESEKTQKIEKIEKTIAPSPSPRVPIPPQEQVDGGEEIPRAITKQAVENISKAGMSVTYRFSDNAAKSHLPRLNTIPIRINRLVPDTPKYQPPTPIKVNGTSNPPPTPIRPPPVKEQKPSVVPLPASPPETTPVSSPNIIASANKIVSTKARPPTPVQSKTVLTSREIEKNSINKLKTLEQPVSKVVVSMRNLDDVVANKNVFGSGKSSGKSRGTQEQTTILFNFQARDTIPDYIATDGTTNTRRGKLEKPKPGESGIILLPGAPAEEFADDDEDWMLTLNGPPSPCDVYFENDNILINGRSSFCKLSKRTKMRIQFDDDATQVFEYLSEASLLEEMVPVPSTPPHSTTSTPGHTVPSLTGSSLASYMPSKMSVTADFQLGMTRATQPPPVVIPPTSTASPATPATEIHSPEQPVTYSAETNADILF